MSITEYPPASLDPRLAPKRSMFMLNEERNVLFTKLGAILVLYGCIKLNIAFPRVL